MVLKPYLCQSLSDNVTHPSPSWDMPNLLLLHAFPLYFPPFGIYLTFNFDVSLSFSLVSCFFSVFHLFLPFKIFSSKCHRPINPIFSIIYTTGNLHTEKEQLFHKKMVFSQEVKLLFLEEIKEDCLATYCVLIITGDGLPNHQVLLSQYSGRWYRQRFLIFF